MAVPIAETMDLVFDRGAVTWADPADLAGEERGAVEAGANDVMCARICAGDPTEELREPPPFAQWRHRPASVVRLLPLERRPVDRPPIQTRRSAGLEA